MAITLVLSQVVGQAFVVKPDGQISPAQANMQLQTGDLVSVPNGKNAWLVTEDGEQVDVLDEALLLNDEGFDSLDLPSDVLSIIAALEEGDDPTQLEDTETAAGEELSSSSAGDQVIVEANGYRGGVSSIEMFDTTGLTAAGLTGAQIDSLSSARYANLFNRASNAQEENSEAKISGDVSATIEDGDVLTASGNLSSSDADGADNRFIAETIQTLRGEMTVNEDGSWTYISTDPTGAIKRLGEGDTLNEYVTVRAADGTEQRITLTFEGSNDVPVFSAISSGEITESDGIMKAAGSINIVDPDAGESFMQPGAFKGEWGTVIIDRAGNWSYTVDNSNKASINSMTDGEKVTDTITVYSVDGTETIITLSINGANDDAIIGGDIAATVVDNSGTLSTSGTLSSTDIDGNDNAFIAETLTTPRGEVTIDENGNWTYTSTDPTGAIERLAEGETLTEVVTVRAEDGTEQQIVLTIEGVNDAPVFSAITTRDVYETNDVISVNGSLNIVDPDAGESFMLAGTYLGDFGSVTIDRAGNWTYTTDPSQSTSLDTLREGEQRVDTITVRSVDGTETDILVTIIGTNDPAQIAGDIVGTIVEADGTLSTSGQLTSTDVDGNDNVFTPQTIAGRWGEITIDADGSWTYVTTDDNGAINRLGEGEQLTDTLSVRAEDGSIQIITITIDGTNDVAVFGGMTNVSVTEADGQLSTSGSVNVSDADTGQSTFQAGTFTGEFGDITIDTAGNWTYTTDPVHSNTFDALDAGDPLPDTITVYAQDGTPLDITVTITGTDDLPVVSGQFGQSLVDTTTGNTLTTSGTINISDVDTDDAPTFENTRIESEYGVLELVDGNWTYTLDKEAASALNAGEVDTDVITLTASDGTQQNIVISITGTNDDPVLRGDTTGSLSDDDNLTISGTIEIIDPDTGDTPTLPNDSIDGSYGTLALVDGEWTYTLNPDSTASLPEGERTTDTITITASDGSTHDIVITITGTDQLPVLEGDTTGAIKEGSSSLTATGTIDLVDVDEGQNPTLPNGTLEGAFGTLEMIDGTWTYTLDPELAQYLDEGQTTQDTISITASDGTVHDIVITITGSEDAAVLGGDTSGSVSDETGAFTTGGSLSINDPDANDNPTLPDANQQGQYGSFSMVDGNWTYTLDPELAQALGEGVEVTDTITISDSMGGTHELVISVTGTDDAAVLTGDTTGVLTEGTDVITTSGTVELIDPDSGDTPTIENTTVTGTFGSLALVDGEWTYTLNPGAAQSLGADQSTTDTLTLTDSTGKEHNIVITLEGTDDAAVVSGDFTGTVTTQTGPEITVNNVFVLGDDIDVDGEQFNANSQPDSMHFDSAGFSATITDSDGQLNNSANQTIEFDGQSYPVSVAATVEYTDVYDNVFTMGVLSIDNGDGTSTTLLVQIGGPDILPGTDLNVVEGSYTEVSSINYVDVTDAPTVSGSLSISDADADDSPTFANTTLEGDYGTFTLTDGNWTYTVDPSRADALNDDQTEQEVFTLTASDGTVQQITVDVTGADDAAVITGDSTASITEDVGAQTASGTITITDADTGDTPTIPNGTLAGQYGSIEMVDGAWTYTADSASIQSLADGDTATDTITVTASDGTTQDIVITITGTDDAAVVTGDTTGNTTDQGASVSGSISISDVDSSENPTISNTTIEGEYGSLTLTDGEWTYTVDPDSAQTLPDGESANDTFTLTASDGSTHQITVTVEGTDDAAVVTGDLSASVAEGGDASVSGSININDPDAAVQPTLENGTVEGEYGSLTLTDGEWTYTVDPSKAQSLGGGDSETDTITITASDGSAHQITITVTGSDDASVVTGVTTGGVDLGADTPGTSTSGTLSISDVDDGDSPSFTNTTIDGDYGTFTLTDGAWTYTIDPAKANALNDNQTEQEVFTLTASDGTVQQITVDVTGADDAAVITGDTTASVTEDVGAQTASGTITITDADTGDTPTIPNGTLVGEYGALTLVDGAWTYTADSASIQSLADGDTTTDTITVTASDGTTQDIVITITGTDDAAVVTGDTTGNTTDQGTTVSGSINISDVDNGENPTISNTTIEGEYGSLSLVDGNWTYTVDPDSAQTLPDGESANDTFTLTASDGSTHQITVTVEGTDDAAVVTGDLSASVAEGGDASVSGSINISDPDAAVQPTLENGTVEGEYGNLTLTDGEWTYTVDPSKAQSLGDGDSETDTITITASDGSEHQITITVTGSDDASVVTGVTTGGVDLGADTPETSTSGTLSIADVDDGDSPSFTNTTIDGDYGTFTLTDGAWTYTIDPAKAGALNDDQTEQDVFTLTASDGTVQQITVDVTGADDAAVITGDTIAAITEDVGTQTASGTITITDADTGDTPTIPNGTLAGEYGSLTLVDGAWTYTADNASIQSLADGDTATDTMTVTASDGTTQDIVITITGTDDAAVITGDSTGSITEDAGAQTASGTLTITDTDTGETPTIPNGTLTGEYGSVTLVDGAWTYTADSASIQSLGDGDIATDTITVTASDGSTQDIVMTITGTDDAAVLSGTSTATITDINASSQNVTVGRGSDGTWDASNGDNLYLNLSNVGSDAAYNNSVGYYVMDAGGNVVRAAIIFDNAHSTNGTSVNINTAGGEKVGLFMIPDGDSKGFNVGSVSLSFGGSSVTAYQGGASSTTFVSDASKNSGYDNEYNSGTYSAWEDIAGGGDRDHNDVTFYVTATQQQESPITASGSVSVSDVDSGDTPTLPNTTIQGEYGSLTMTNGNWTYTFDPDKASAIDEETLETIVITDSEGGKHEIVIAIQGTDDAPIVTGVFSGAVTEGDGDDVITVSGTLSISDADADDTPEFENTTIDGQYGSLTLADGEWTYTLDPVKSQVLSDTDFVQDTITLTATDGTTQNVVISVTGTDDAAVITGDTTAAITEDVGAQTASGTITITDADTGDTPTIPNGTLAGEYGSLTLVDGAWTYTADSASIQSLGDGDTATDTITVTASDGSTQDIVITITGTNDVAVVTGDTSGDVTDQNTSISGSISVSDIDDGETATIDNTTIEGEYGSLVLVDGNWTFNVDSEKAQTLPDGQSANDVFTLTASDGSTHQITVTVEGTDDAAVVTGDLSASVAEGGDASVSGSINISDPDAAVQPTLDNGTVEGEYGNLTLTDGEWTYTVDPSKTQSLGDGDSETDTITITASDGSEHQITITVTGSDDASVVTGVTTGGVDLGADSPETSTSGTLSISDVDDGDSPSFTNTTIEGDYGTFTLTDGAWTYTIDPAKANALNDNQTEQEAFTLTASDGTVQQITVDVTGTEDAAVITGDTTASLTEDVGTQTASGTITITDADTGDTPTIPNGTLAGEYGSLTLVDGAWTYTADNASIQSLADGDTATDTITVTASDGTTQDIVITITGTDDAAVVTGDTAGNTTDQGTTVSGSINISDVDNGENPTISNTTIEGEYGSLSLVDGNWTYTVDPDSAQTLPDGESANDTFTLTASDGSTHQITVTVEGTDDAAVVAGVTTGGVDLGADTPETSVSGTLSITDVDDGDTPSFTNTTIDGDYGTFTLTDGAWTYTIDPAKANALNDNQTEQEVFTLTASDGTVQQITVDVTGADDAAVITGDTTASVTEDVGAQTASGTITITDADTDDTPTIPNGTLVGEYGALTLVDGAWTYTADSASIQSLADGDTATDTITVTASDGTTQDIVITITGTDDAAVISGETSGNITEDTGAQTASGTITITDADTGETPTIPNGTLAGEYGSLTLVDGAWTYTVDTDAVQSLAQGQETTDTITLTASDGSTVDVVISLTGTNDAAVVTGDLSASVAEGGEASVSGSININDPDAAVQPTLENGTVEGEYGSLTLTDGEWTYTVDPSKAQSLGDGDSEIDTITITASDGSEHQITITVTGSDDASVVTGVTTGGVDLGADTPETSTSGTLSISDVDDGDSPSFTNTTIDGDYGTFTLTDGAWTYTIDPAKANALNDNQTEQEVFTLTASDGTVQQITVDVTGADDAAVITGDSTASITEDVGAQTASGTITITDADTGDTPTIPNGTLAGEYGSLTLVDGAWTYTVDTDAVQSLGDGDSATDTITVTASDGSTQDIVISLTGTDDAAEISGTVVGTIDAESLTNTREVGENLLVNGNFESFGNNESVEWTTLTSEQIPGWYTPDGAVIEVQQGTMDGAPTNANNNSVMELDAYHNTTVQQDVNVSALAQNGDSTLSLSFDYASRLSNTSQFEVTVFDQDGKVLFTQFFDNQQANDHYENVQADFSLPSGTDSVTLSISGQGESDSIGALIDNVSLNPVTFDNALLTTSGSITISDVDEGDSPEFENTSITGTYGTLVLVDGQWTYTLDPQKSAELSEGETAQDVITLTASDGTTQDIIITVLGDNDVSSIIGNTTGEVIEGNVGDVITTSGTLTVSDIDNDAATIPDGTQTGQFGTLSIVNGEWTYTLNNEKADTLNEDQSANDTFTVTTSDGTTQDININITGSNDAAVLSGTSTASITDTSASSQNVTVGRGSDGTWDASNGDNLYLNLNNVNSDAAYSNSVGYYVLDAGGNVVRAAIIFDNAHSTNGTSVNINTSGGEKVGLFMIPDGDSKGFNVGSVSLSFGGSSVTAYQGGASSTTFVSDSSKNSGYDNEYNSGTYSAWEDIAGGGDRDHNDVTFYVSATQQQESPITASGSVSVSDVDSGDTPTLPNTTVQGEFGSLTMTNGNWTYTFDPDKASAIDEETLETIVITDSEGGKHEIVIAIQGTDDAPIVTGVFSGAVTEGDADDVITVSGTISISDADADDSPDFENTTIDGQYGSLTLADGEWTYTLDPVKSQVLSETDFVQDTITLTATDGTTQNVVISVTGTDDAPFVVGTNSATIIAPDSATQDYIDINNGFVLGDGYSFSGGDMQYYGNEPTLTFNDSGSTIRIYDTDSRMDGDAYSNEYVQDSSQKVEINGVLYTATYDYQLDYQDSSGNIYSFAVLDVDLDRDGGYEYDANEQGKVIIQIDGPTITPGISMEYIRDTPNQPSSMSYSDFVDGDVASLEAHGTLSVLDVDANDSQAVFADTTVTGQYGSLELVDGNWTYTLDPRSTPALGDNDAITEVITLTATNGAQTEVNVTIGGSENAIANASLSGLSQSLSDVISLDDVTFSGSDSNDRIAGSDSADVLLGNAGHDVILGGSGNDFIDGGLGDDLILGGQGNDLMAGGAGSDTFAFLNGDQSTSSTPTVDHIADFDTSQDAINLSDLMQTEPSDTLESFLSLIDDGEGNAMLNIASQGDGNVDQQVVFDNMSVEDMASAYSVDISGMTSEQVSTSVIDAMIMQSKMIID